MQVLSGISSALVRRSAALIIGIGAALWFTPLDVFYAQSALPTRLLQASDFVHQGSFTLPDAQDTTGVYAFEYTQGVIAFNPANQSLFVVGHDWTQQVAEVRIPALGGRATLLQGFRDPLDGRMNQINPSDPNSKKIGGMYVIGDKLILAAYSYYDGAGSAVASHFVRSTTLTSGGVQGPFKVGSLNPAFTAGYFAPVPPLWQASLGGALLNGQCCLGVISRTSYGPSVSVVNPSDLLAARNPTTAAMLVGYPEAHQTLAAHNSTGPLFNGTTIMRGVVLPEATNSVVFFGRHGMGTYCYGEPAACGDPEDSGKGTHAYPYEPHLWFYRASDLADVKAGRKQPWDVKPYATGKLPGFNSANIGGVTVDPATGRIFVAQNMGDGVKLRIHVFTVNGSGASAQTPLPPPSPEPTPSAPAPSAPAPSAPSAPAPSAPSATTPTGWTLSWADEFDGTSVNTTHWNVENSTTYSYGGALQAWRPANVTVSGGVLRLTSRREAASNRQYTSGAVTTKNKVTFGPEFKLEVRARLPRGRGLWPAIWTREGQMPNPDVGVELDIMENLGHDTNTVYHVQHLWNLGGVAHVQQVLCTSTTADYSQNFHTFGVEVTGGRVRWFVDGQQRCESTSGLPTQPSHLLLNTSIGGDWPGAPDGTTPFPQEFAIDYVRLYTRGTGGSTTPPPASPPADTQAPTVSLTTPAAGALVSGQVTVTASASDNVGVAGVQFTLNGANLGPEDTSAPYQITWNTTALANSAYTLRAIARDAAGNSRTSVARTVTVLNTTPTPPQAPQPPATPPASQPPSSPSSLVRALPAPEEIPPSAPSLQACPGTDPFAAMGGGTCHNGGWLPPGMTPSDAQAPASTTPPPTSTGNAVGCSTPDPFAAMGGGTCHNGGWLPPGMTPPANTQTPAPPAAPPPSSTGNSVGCSTPDPFAVLGGGTCHDGGWLPPGMAPPSLSSAPTPPAPPVNSTGCQGSDPFISIPGLRGNCVNGGWIPVVK